MMQQPHSASGDCLQAVQGQKKVFDQGAVPADEAGSVQTQKCANTKGCDSVKTAVADRHCSSLSMPLGTHTHTQSEQC